VLFDEHTHSGTSNALQESFRKLSYMNWTVNQDTPSGIVQQFTKYI